MKQHQQTSHPYLSLVPTHTAPRVRRMSEHDAEVASLSLLRGWGGGDLVEGLGKLQMMRALDCMQGDWLGALEANLHVQVPPPAAMYSSLLAV